eukprot:597530-Pelagomonas_calceolata.AAC.1
MPGIAAKRVAIKALLGLLLLRIAQSFCCLPCVFNVVGNTSIESAFIMQRLCSHSLRWPSCWSRTSHAGVRDFVCGCLWYLHPYGSCVRLLTAPSSLAVLKEAQKQAPAQARPHQAPNHQDLLVMSKLVEQS